jgi:hypothetical protein
MKTSIRNPFLGCPRRTPASCLVQRRLVGDSLLIDATKAQLIRDCTVSCFAESAGVGSGLTEISPVFLRRSRATSGDVPADPRRRETLDQRCWSRRADVGTYGAREDAASWSGPAIAAVRIAGSLVPAASRAPTCVEDGRNLNTLKLLRPTDRDRERRRARKRASQALSRDPRLRTLLVMPRLLRSRASSW